MTDSTANTPLPYQKLTITAIKEEAKNIKTFELKRDDSSPINYKPGQYLTLVHQTDRAEVRRSYSITSTPVLQEPLTIGVKRIENGFFSRRLVDDARVGDQVLTTGAAGFFILPDDMKPSRQVFFLAAGSGITPIYALLKTVLFAYPDVAVVLLYSNNSANSTMFLEPLQQLKQQFPERLHIEFIFSDSPDLSRAHLYKDLLQLYLKTYSIATPEQQLFYVCGPLNYMRMCLYTLRLSQVPSANIRKESFNTPMVLPQVAPPDQEMHLVTFHYKGKMYKVPTQYPLNILKAARQHGIALPYSCETGKCGNCVARILRGNVWMSYNEVLTDRETADGLTLTCVGFPLDGDVELEII